MTCKYFKPYMRTLREIVDQYYKFDRCGAGGPLHVLLDDDNYDIHTVHFCLKECFKELNTPEKDRVYGHSNEVYILGIMICNEYAKMSLEERAVFDAYKNGQVVNECEVDCSMCSLLGGLYYDMIEEEDVE